MLKNILLIFCNLSLSFSFRRYIKIKEEFMKLKNLLLMAFAISLIGGQLAFAQMGSHMGLGQGAGSLWADNETVFPGQNGRMNAPGQKMYYEFEEDLSNDVFINRGRFVGLMNSLEIDNISYQDENGDEIADIFQDSAQFHETFPELEFIDENGDTIDDRFQTAEMYRFFNMDNFVDSDNDSVCDNYENNNFVNNGDRYYARYFNYTLNLENDIFQSKEKFDNVTRGMGLHNLQFIDENENGIGDIFEDTDYFHESFPDTEFVDENADGIHDEFQERGFYRAIGMRNFVDNDGDGLCDNYENNDLGIDDDYEFDNESDDFEFDNDNESTDDNDDFENDNETQDDNE